MFHARALAPGPLEKLTRRVSRRTRAAHLGRPAAASPILELPCALAASCVFPSRGRAPSDGPPEPEATSATASRADPPPRRRNPARSAHPLREDTGNQCDRDNLNAPARTHLRRRNHTREPPEGRREACSCTLSCTRTAVVGRWRWRGRSCEARARASGLRGQAGGTGPERMAMAPAPHRRCVHALPPYVHALHERPRSAPHTTRTSISPPQEPDGGCRTRFRGQRAVSQGSLALLPPSGAPTPRGHALLETAPGHRRSNPALCPRAADVRGGQG